MIWPRFDQHHGQIFSKMCIAKWPTFIYRLEQVFLVKVLSVGCIGHCPHLWNLPLQPFPANLLHTDSSVQCCAGWNGCGGDFDRCGQYPIDFLRLPLSMLRWTLPFDDPGVLIWSTVRVSINHKTNSLVLIVTKSKAEFCEARHFVCWNKTIIYKKKIQS